MVQTLANPYLHEAQTTSTTEQTSRKKSGVARVEAMGDVDPVPRPPRPMPTPDEVHNLVMKLRPHEVRWLAEDVVNASIAAYESGAIQELDELLFGWLATADVMLTTRRRLRYIMRAREEGRERFGGSKPSL